MPTLLRQLGTPARPTTTTWKSAGTCERLSAQAQTASSRDVQNEYKAEERQKDRFGLSLSG